ncbi:helix-turn-helix domain-containing protein, partial [Bacteroidota bacterium]
MNKIDKLVERRVKEILRLNKIIFLIEFIGESKRTASEILKEYNVSRSTYYEWKKKYDREGKKGLEKKKPIPRSHPKQLSQDAINKIFELRKTYHLGPARITWYLERYYNIKTSESTVTRTLKRHGVSRLPKTASKRTVHTKRYAKSAPGHHVQIDVKFVIF